MLFFFIFHIGLRQHTLEVLGTCLVKVLGKEFEEAQEVAHLADSLLVSQMVSLAHVLGL